jgi:membrane protein DedA with SNARE-associated domain
MHAVLQFLLRHGYLLLFGFVFAEQIGLPIPAIPILLGAGALAGWGSFSFAIALVVAAVAAMLSDLIWYELGRRRGHSVVTLICRVALEPDSCVRQTTEVFGRYGSRALLFAKFIPGLNTAAPPLAGLARVSRKRFLLFDGAGSLVWAGLFLTLGYLFSPQLEQIANWGSRLGAWMLALLAGGLAGYVCWKYWHRRRFLRMLQASRITPDELRRRLEGGEDVMIVDVRHALEWELEGVKLPGALQLQPGELQLRHLEIPRDREIVLYCS